MCSYVLFHHCEEISPHFAMYTILLGGLSTPASGRLIPPFTVSVNVFRLTHVFFVGVLLCDTVGLIYIQAADCTLCC